MTALLILSLALVVALVGGAEVRRGRWEWFQ